jgi:DMSO/TMAO reductase YedYZ molybdopterin-dependent catalytic subunit
MPDSNGPPARTQLTAEQQMRCFTRRSLLVGAAATLAGLGTWHWLRTARPESDEPWPLRRMLRFNQDVAEGLGSPHHLAPVFPSESVQGPARINGGIGLSNEVDGTHWQLRVQHEGRVPEQTISLREILALPRYDLVTELKCVEGWSQVMHFGGVRFLDFVTQFGLATRSGRPPDPERLLRDLFPYVYLATLSEDYYVGLDMASALHPQTLLCDRMNGQPLAREHGAPVRLYLAVKYGYKSLKRIALIRFQDERPSDYWARRGYDWYAGL